MCLWWGVVFFLKQKFEFEKKKFDMGGGHTGGKGPVAMAAAAAALVVMHT